MRRGKITVSFLLCSIFTSSSYAQLADEKGFNGSIGAFFTYSKLTSNLNLEKRVKSSPLNTNAEEDVSGVIDPYFTFDYTFGDTLEKQFAVGVTDFEISKDSNPIAFTYNQELDSGALIGVSYLPNLVNQKVFSDPYATDVKRSQTTEYSQAVNLKIGQLVYGLLEFNLAASQTNIDHEAIAENKTSIDHSLLKRDAMSYYANASFIIPFTETFLAQPLISYTSSDAQGRAQTYEEFLFQLCVLKLVNENQFILKMIYSNNVYDAVNPVFNNQREDNSYNLTSTMVLKNQLPIDNLSLFAQVSFEKTDSNISFYDSEELSSTMGLMYSF